MPYRPADFFNRISHKKNPQTGVRSRLSAGSLTLQTVGTMLGSGFLTNPKSSVHIETLKATWTRARRLSYYLRGRIVLKIVTADGIVEGSFDSSRKTNHAAIVSHRQRSLVNKDASTRQMMGKFTKRTAEFLNKSGWYPNRNLDATTSAEALNAAGFVVHEAAADFLTEYGGLYIKYPHAKVADMEDEMHFDPLIVITHTTPPL